MSRIRSIKPEFNSSESVNRLSDAAALFMVKILPEVDDHGRIRWLPKMIAGTLYPHRESFGPKQVEPLVAELERECIFLRYDVGGVQYGCFPNWTTHQKISNPSKSKCPPPSDIDFAEFLRKDSARSVQGLCNGSRKGEEGSRNKEGGGGSAGAADPLSQTITDFSKPTPSEFMLAWNEAVPFSQIRTMSDKRQEALRTRRCDPDWRRDWLVAIAKIRGSPFMRGENDRNWKADVDFFLRPDTVTRILEGRYDGSGTNGRTSRPLSGVEAAPGKYAGVRLFGEGGNPEATDPPGPPPNVGRNDASAS